MARRAIPALPLAAAMRLAQNVLLVAAVPLATGLLATVPLATGLLVATPGCTRAPKRIVPPGISASAAGKGAMAEYDTDGDGAVAGDELEKAPSLKAALGNLDSNQDGRVTADEVQARVEAWQESRIGIMSLGCRVTLDGNPLTGANVTFEPEKFLGDEVHAASGTTDQSGSAYLTIAEEHRQDPAIAGAQCGLYKVRITAGGGEQMIPAQYNTKTTLGAEVAQDAPWQQTGLQFDLTSGKKKR